MEFKIKTGDYIEIKPGVHDDRMPFSRRDGLVVEIIGPRRDQVVIMFCNGEFLKFHESQIQMFKKIL
jgi:hypothetical protein